jgi:hypothetical protein
VRLLERVCGEVRAGLGKRVMDMDTQVSRTPSKRE